MLCNFKIAGVPKRIVRCKSSKGFGASTPRQKGGQKTSKTPQQVADQALAEAAKSRPKVRPINPKEAARGKVDYVQVKDWANGSAADIGELQVVPGSLGTGYATAGASSPAGAADSMTGPFYQQLAQHAQYLEAQGALSIASSPGQKPYLPFESWQYTLDRYSQYLAEVAAVHQALEEALQLALAPPAASSTASDSSSGSSSRGSIASSSSGPWAVQGREEGVVAAYDALACFGPSCGLWRAAAAQADLAALAGSTGAAAAADQVGHQAQQQQQQERKLKQIKAQGVHASQNAVAYGKYLLQLGRAAGVATETAAAAAHTSNSNSSSKKLGSEEAEGSSAALKLLAHAYAIQVQQQCLGTRIGAAATQQLQLLAVPAAALYMDYPEWVQEPVQQLMKVTDAAGRAMGAAGRQVVLDELPRALKKSALLLAPLAMP